MTPSKLSETDKRDIVNLYKQAGETTATLADRYGVSSSTVSRILRSGLSTEEYETLVQQKRTARFQSTASASQNGDETTITAQVQQQPTAHMTGESTASEQEPDIPVNQQSSENGTDSPEKPVRQRHIRKRTAPIDQSEFESATDDRQLELINNDEQHKTEFQPEPVSSAVNIPEEVLHEEFSEQSQQQLSTFLNDEFENFADDDDDDDDDDFVDDDLDDFEEEDFDSFEDEADIEAPDGQIQNRDKQPPIEADLQILPFAKAAIPRTCYVVVDRTAELITRPLKAFRELGRIPEEEILARTLPIFDNHRVAKRFSNQKQNQRIIKVPDGRLLHKVKPYLQAKGITRLLIDGQVYAL